MKLKKKVHKVTEASILDLHQVLLWYTASWRGFSLQPSWRVDTPGVSSVGSLNFNRGLSTVVCAVSLTVETVEDLLFLNYPAEKTQLYA